MTATEAPRTAQQNTTDDKLMVGWTCSYNTPHETDGLTSSTNPADQPREEETEAESDDGVAPEHVSVEEPVDGDGGGQHPGHVPDEDAANHLDEEESVIMFVNS